MKLKLYFVDGRTLWVEAKQVVINDPGLPHGAGFSLTTDHGEWGWNNDIMYATLDGERIYPPTENKELSEPVATLKPYSVREDLLSMIEKAFVKEDLWHNRDSASAQKQLGECYALLKCGCDFYILTDGDLKTDNETIWIEILSKGFSYHEYNAGADADTYYIPTESRLEKANGSDWY